MPSPIRCLWGISLMVGVGCVSAEETQPTAYPEPWALPEAWSLVDPSNDPVVGRPMDAHTCPSEAMRLEFDVPELDTGACAWITIAAPALYGIPSGTLVRVALVHDNLIAEQPADSTFVIQTTRTVLYERTVSLPQPAQVVDERVVIPEGVRTGEILYVHVHNHGANSYRLLALQPEPALGSE